MKSLKFSLKKKIDNYLEKRIERIVSEKLNFNTPQNRKVFELGYFYLQWDLATRNGAEKVVKELEHGLRLNCYIDSDLSREIFSNNFENNELVFLKKYLKKGDVFVDIGGNIGLFSIHACYHVGNEGRVITYEPTPRTYDRLIENVTLNSFANIDTYRVAISDDEKPHEFKISLEGYDAWNSLAIPSRGESYQTVQVDCRTIDNIVKDDRVFSKAKLIKIDVEGWELHVLKGGEAFFGQPAAPVLLIEFTEQNAINAGTSCQELYEYLNYLGYNLYMFNSADLSLTLTTRKTYEYQNLVAIKEIDKVKMELVN